MPKGNDYELIDNAYGQHYKINGESIYYVDLYMTNSNQTGWYDLTLRSKSQSWERKFMGRVEQEHEGITDPAMGVDQF